MTFAEMWVLLAVYFGVFLIGAFVGLWWDRVVRQAWRRWRHARARRARILAHETRTLERRAHVAALAALVVDGRTLRVEHPREYPAGCAWPAMPPPSTEAAKARVTIAASSPVPVWGDMSEGCLAPQPLGARRARRERHLAAVPNPASKAREGVINSRPGGEGS